MNKQFFKDTFGWGVFLWAVGYVLSLALFSIVPTSMLGWVIMPIGSLITLLVLLKKIPEESYQYYLSLASVWTFIAIVFDYFFVLKTFQLGETYYKLDVYLYYAITFILPLLTFYYKKEMSHVKSHVKFEKYQQS